MHSHMTSLRHLPDSDVDYLVRRGAWFAGPESRGHRPLADLVVGGFFRATSTRTRTAFASAALRLGAGHVAYGPGDLQLNTGESMEDTARVLARMLDALVVRTAGDPREVEALAGQERMAVVNAMSADEHPTQALADLTTMWRHFGRIAGLRILYVGEGNNTAAALALALPRYAGVSLCLATPPGYGLDAEILAEAVRLAKEHDASVWETHDLADAPGGVDVVYTTRWQTTGTSKPDPDWRAAFAPFQVNRALMARHPEAVFMHDLPAHRGEDVTAEVLDGAASIAFDQAENKTHSAKAVLEWCILGRNE
ncbi:ornithine carbamoyltransferase [Planotetraspora sp. GP83]|uniref:ornithine carbamoyltransferase n=1 Tax=Planotetraspora sp. GP83 TaxID=3156264 RepID=UPI003514ADBB